MTAPALPSRRGRSEGSRTTTTASGAASSGGATRRTSRAGSPTTRPPTWRASSSSRSPSRRATSEAASMIWRFSFASRSAFICPSSVRRRARRAASSALLTWGASTASSAAICFSRSSSCFWYWSAFTLSLRTRWVSTTPTADPHPAAATAAARTRAASPAADLIRPIRLLHLAPHAGDERVRHVGGVDGRDRLREDEIPPLLLGQRGRLHTEVGHDALQEPRPLGLDRLELGAEGRVP